MLLNAGLGFGAPNQTSFFPSYSLHDRAFAANEVDRALELYLRDNPMYSAYTLKEQRIASPEMVTCDMLWDMSDEHFEDFRGNFMVNVVHFDEAPTRTAFICFAPVSKIDGFTMFKFHQRLSQTITSGKDQFQNAAMARELRLTPGVFPTIPAPTFSAEAREACGRASYTYEKFDGMTSQKAGQLALSKAATSGARSLVTVRNAAYASGITFGNFLVYVPIPLERVDPPRLHEQFREDGQLQVDLLNRCEKPEDFEQLLGKVLGEMSGGYAINNYGSCVKISAETLLDYKWAMPSMLNPVKSGVTLLIGLAGRSQAISF
jgi:hypothetical protein